MDLEDQFLRYFGSTDLDGFSPGVAAAGTERLRVDFGLEKDRARRFALWAMMHVLGVAPDLDIAFPDAEDQDAARTFMELTE